MSTWALVPIKRRDLCKTRLATVLQPREREALVQFETAVSNPSIGARISELRICASIFLWASSSA